MTLLAAADLLATWERARELSPLARGLTLLAAFEPEAGPRALAALPLGEIHRRCLALFERWCGPELLACAQCPACGEKLEVCVALGDLWLSRAGMPGAPADEGFAIVSNDVHLRFRLLTGLDLLCAARCVGSQEARFQLLHSCVLAAERDGVSLALEELDPAVTGLLGEAMEQLDPGGDPRVEVACAACGHTWELALDVALFLWEKLEVESQRLLNQVDTLARVYHWRERDVLRMSPVRRQSYLRMAAR